ncbi:MAG: hypothetical protein ABIT08_08915 [Bacteroidia bacterium]
MKTYLKLLVFCLISFSSLKTFAQINIAHFKQLMNDENYKAAYEEAMALRKQPYGKCFQVDYIIAKCLCETNNERVAKKCFSQMSNYPLSEKMKSLLKEEEMNCGKTGDESSSDVLLTLLNVIANTKNDQPVSISRGKLGTVINCNQNTSSGAASSAGDFELKINMSQEEFSERLFTLDKSKEAKQYYDHLLGNGYRVDTSGRFILITRKYMGSTPGNAASIAKKMQMAYSFYLTNFDLKAPDKLIAVYLMGDKPSLQEAALKVHGFKLPKENLGYSCLGDLSVLGTSDTAHIGTLYHELFHLVVRAEIGDIPAWLDEGVASIYETSRWKGNNLKGDVYNWRTQVVKNYMEAGAGRSLRYIITQNWDGFKVGPNNDICDIAYNYAYSKHFALFLQEKKLLKPVLQAFSNRQNVFTDTANVNETDFEILERSMGIKMNEIQNQFNAWFDSVYVKKDQVTIYKNTYRNLQFQLNQTRIDLQHVGYFRLSEQDRALQKEYIIQCEKYIAQKKNTSSENESNVVSQNGTADTNFDPDLKIEQFVKESRKFIKAHTIHD